MAEAVMLQLPEIDVSSVTQKEAVGKADTTDKADTVPKNATLFSTFELVSNAGDMSEVGFIISLIVTTFSAGFVYYRFGQSRSENYRRTEDSGD
jgi:hypothetical protein